jgi:uncharacterized protein with NAD-binding domain and iron-sulfur cluster
MSIDKRMQLNVPYEQFASFRVKQIINTLSQERKQIVMEQIQAKILLEGKEIVNQELFNKFLTSLRKTNEDKPKEKEIKIKTKTKAKKKRKKVNNNG